MVGRSQRSPFDQQQQLAAEVPEEPAAAAKDAKRSDGDARAAATAAPSVAAAQQMAASLDQDAGLLVGGTQERQQAAAVLAAEMGMARMEDMWQYGARSTSASIASSAASGGSQGAAAAAAVGDDGASSCRSSKDKKKGFKGFWKKLLPGGGSKQRGGCGNSCVDGSAGGVDGSAGAVSAAGLRQDAATPSTSASALQQGPSSCCVDDDACADACGCVRMTGCLPSILPRKGKGSSKVALTAPGFCSDTTAAAAAAAGGCADALVLVEVVPRHAGTKQRSRNFRWSKVGRAVCEAFEGLGAASSSSLGFVGALGWPLYV